MLVAVNFSGVKGGRMPTRDARSPPFFVVEFPPIVSPVLANMTLKETLHRRISHQGSGLGLSANGGRRQVARLGLL